MLDMCTGSGCIAVSLARPWADTRMWQRQTFLPRPWRWQKKTPERYPVDVSPESDMFAAFEPGRDMFDVIVSNPPYIPSEVIAGPGAGGA